MAVSKCCSKREPSTSCRPSNALVPPEWIRLRDLALFSITAGNKTGRAGSIDMSILIDTTTLLDGVHDHSLIDCGLSTDFPWKHCAA